MLQGQSCQLVGHCGQIVVNSHDLRQDVQVEDLLGCLLVYRECTGLSELLLKFERVDRGEIQILHDHLVQEVGQ